MPLPKQAKVSFTAANIVRSKNVDKKPAVTYIADDFPAATDIDLVARQVFEEEVPWNRIRGWTH